MVTLLNSAVGCGCSAPRISRRMSLILVSKLVCGLE
jgi:hypothetical protein